MLFLVFEIIWVAQILRRFPKDLKDLTRPRVHLDRVVMIIIWLITLAMISHLVWYTWGLIKPTLKFYYPNL